MSTIIILNGTSSSGKTSIRKEFQNLTKDFYYDFTMDNFTGVLPQKYLNFNEKIKMTKDHKLGLYFDKKTRTAKSGKHADKMREDMCYVIKTLADRKSNIVADLVLFNLEKTKLLAKLLENHTTYLIRVVCSVEELRKREKARKDRNIGMAEKQLSNIDTRYNDFVLDSNHKTPKQLAKELIKFIENNKPKAFDNLL
jgi:chloramphenicol 3-O phosphotransferase